MRLILENLRNVPAADYHTCISRKVVEGQLKAHFTPVVCNFNVADTHDKVWWEPLQRNGSIQRQIVVKRTNAKHR